MIRLIRAVRSVAILFASLVFYSLTGRTPASGLQAMIHVHAITNGASSAALAALFRLSRPALRLGSVRDPTDLFSTLGAEEVDAIVGKLRDEGYAISPIRVPADAVARLRAFAESTPGNPWDAEGRIGPKQPYDRTDLSLAKLQFDATELLTQPDVQNLAADSGLLDIAQRHLGGLPVLDSVAMWWSTPHLDQAADEIAQTYHIDYDRVRWLKVFIYLTDVTPENGPHVFVRHSHLRESRRAELIGRGYVRIPDEDVQRVYRPDEIVTICGPGGTVLFEDTSGFHKGTMPESRERLMLEFQFSCNLFGANYEPMRLVQPVGTRLEAARRALPGVYTAFI